MSVGHEKFVPDFLIRADADVNQGLDEIGLRYRAAENAYEQGLLDGIFRRAVAPVMLFLGRNVRVASDWHYIFKVASDGQYEPQDQAVEGFVPGVFDFMYIGTFTSPTTHTESTLLSVGLTTDLPELYGEEHVKLLTPVSYITNMALVTGVDLN